MKLDFNFQIKNYQDENVASAKAVIEKVLEQSSNTDENYIDKINNWGKAINKNGFVDLDAVDAKVLKDMVIKSVAIVTLAKGVLKDYIQKRIDETKK
jgi:hypothetical protein